MTTTASSEGPDGFGASEHLLPTCGPPSRCRTTPPLVYLAFLFPALAGLLYGYDIGSAIGAVVALSDSNVPPLTPLGSALLTSASLVGALLGSLLVFHVGEV